MRYVTFTDGNNVTHLGILLDPTKDPRAEKALHEGYALIEDLIRPRNYRFHAELLRPLPWGRVVSERKAAFLQATDLCGRVGQKVVTGVMFGIPVEGKPPFYGTAWYVVTRTKHALCLVEHRKFDAASNMTFFFGMGGWFNKGDVEPYVKKFGHAPVAELVHKD